MNAPDLLSRDSAEPALYEGTIGHRRTEGAEHVFSFGAFYAYLDVETVDATLAGLPGWSASRPAPMRFHREDYLEGTRRPLGDAVRDLVADRTGHRPDGPVLLLTQVRTMGFVFNPISVYFCWNADRSELDAMVLEVTNTPWKERCWYVLPPEQRDEDGAWRFPKTMHVSPFLDMDLSYRVRLEGPGTRLRLRVDDCRGDKTVLATDLDLQQVPLDARHAVLVPLRHPLQTFRVFALIHTHAVRLWRKRVRIHGHPDRGRDEPAAEQQANQPMTTATRVTSRRMSHGQ